MAKATARSHTKTNTYLCRNAFLWTSPCPKCGDELRGGAIGIYDWGRRETTAWQCLKCDYVWDAGHRSRYVVG